MPFRDKCFDYSVCSHIQEHTEAPILFLQEIERISHSGYIETPSPLRESLSPFPIHTLQVGLDSASLIISFKQDPWCLPNLSPSNIFSRELLSNPTLLVTRYSWMDKTTARLINQPPSQSWIEEIEDSSDPISFGSSVQHSARSLRSLLYTSLTNLFHTLPLFPKVTIETLMA